MKNSIIHSQGVRLIQCSIVFFIIFFILDCGLCKQKVNTSSLNNTITLNQAVQIALKNNRSLQRSRLSLASSNLNVQLQNERFNIKIIPASSINYNSSDDQYWSVGVKIFKDTKVGISGSITPKIENTADGLQRYSVSFMLNVPLLKGLGTDYKLDSLYGSLYALETARRAHYKQQDGLVINTISTVYWIINFQKQIDLHRPQIVFL